jgi:hypothetical protein
MGFCLTLAEKAGVRVPLAPSEGAMVSLFFLPLIVMPLDGEEHARAKHENLKRDKDYREPIHHFEYFQAIT